MADIGDNNPPEPTSLERAEDLVILANRWLTERPEITDDDMAAKATDFVTQLRKASKTLDLDKAAAKSPHKHAIDVIDATYRHPTSKLALALDAMRLKLTAWGDVLTKRQEAAQNARAEEARRAQHEAEKASLEADIALEKGGNVIEAQLAARDAQERAAEAIVAVVAPAEPVRIRGEFSERAMGMRTTWHAEITNWDVALRKYRNHPVVHQALREAVLAVATQVARHAKDESAAPPGFRFFKTQKAT